MPETEYTKKVLEATGISHQKPGTQVPGFATKTRHTPRFRGKVVGPRIDLRRVASSRLLEAPYAYVQPCRGLELKQFLIQARFSIFSVVQCSVGVLPFFSFIFLFRFYILQRAERFRERQRGIDVIDGDNLCKGVSFLLHCNLLHLLHDAQLISFSHGNLTTNH